METSVVEQIKAQLPQIEAQEQVKILYACESGSRAWGFPSEDSDYDIRFIYVHPRDWYLSIKPGRDVIDYPVDGLIDLGGWDIRKCFSLLRKSNCALIEWLSSPIRYYSNNQAIAPLQELIAQAFLPESSCHHYIAMAKRKYEQVTQSQDVTLKAYCYALRATLCAFHIVKHQSPPPMLIDDMVENDVLDNVTRGKINKLIELKKSSIEKGKVERLTWLEVYIETCLRDIESKIPTNPVKQPLAMFDDAFRQTLQIVGVD